MKLYYDNLSPRHDGERCPKGIVAILDFNKDKWLVTPSEELDERTALYSMNNVYYTSNEVDVENLKATLKNGSGREVSESIRYLLENGFREVRKGKVQHDCGCQYCRANKPERLGRMLIHANAAMVRVIDNSKQETGRTAIWFCPMCGRYLG